jgi:nitrate reductase alpha subunit
MMLVFLLRVTNRTSARFVCALLLLVVAAGAQTQWRNTALRVGWPVIIRKAMTMKQPYTPAWSEKYTGLSRNVLLRFAREWGETAERTKGRCTVIIGAGINHWYHANLMYRAAIHALMFGGCIGVNGGGLAHYVGQEKLAPGESWAAIAFARDWMPAVRLQNAPSWALRAHQPVALRARIH